MRKPFTAATIALALSLNVGHVHAGDSKGSNAGNHGGSHAGHSEMKATPGNKEAVAVGVVNSIDAANGTINITHEPVPELDWPKMTMDLPVTRRVNLSKVETGKSVNFTLKQGRDKQFRVIAIEPKE